MTALRTEFEALMPEAAGFRTRYRSEPKMIGHYPWTYADAERRHRKYDRPAFEYEDLYTADQMRAMFDAATERAAKLAADLAYDAAIKYANGYPVDFEQEVAAAIRATGGEG
jgi:hypothetical protein